MKINEMSVGATVSGAVATAPSSMGKMRKRTEEAANPAQQAAIAVNMKKAGKKPKQGVAEGSALDQQAMVVADKLTSGKNLEKLKAMAHDSTVYRALDRYFAKNNIPENIYNRVAVIVFNRINEQGVAEGTPVNMGALLARSDRAGRGAPWWAKATDINYMGDTKSEGPVKFKVYFPNILSWRSHEMSEGDIVKKAKSLGMQQDDNGDWYYPLNKLNAAVKHELTNAKYWFGDKIVRANPEEDLHDAIARLKTKKNKKQNQEETIDEEKQRLDPSCWKGYKKQGTKMKGGVRVNNCVPKESVESSSSIMRGMLEAHVNEEEVLLVPGQGVRFKPDLMPKKNDHEVSMAKQQLIELAQNAELIYHCIKDVSEMQGLDGWVQKKITIANEYMEAVSSYLESKRQEVEEQNQLQGTGFQQGNSVVQANPNAVQRDIQASNQLGGTLSNINSLRQGGANTVANVDPRAANMVGQMRTDQTDVNKRLAVAGVGQAPAAPQQPQATNFSQYKDDLEETQRLSAHEKFKRGLKRAGYDPDAGAQRLLDLIARQKKEREEFELRQKEEEREFYKRLKEQEQQQDQQQDQQQKGNNVSNILGAIQTVGRTLNTFKDADLGKTLAHDLQNVIRNKVTREPNR